MFEEREKMLDECMVRLKEAENLESTEEVCLRLVALASMMIGYVDGLQDRRKSPAREYFEKVSEQARDVPIYDHETLTRV